MAGLPVLPSHIRSDWNVM